MCPPCRKLQSIWIKGVERTLGGGGLVRATVLSACYSSREPTDHPQPLSETICSKVYFTEVSPRKKVSMAKHIEEISHTLLLLGWFILNASVFLKVLRSLTCRNRA